MSAMYWWVKDEDRAETCTSEQHPYVTAKEYECSVERGDREESRAKLLELQLAEMSTRRGGRG
jgi:hypothetical protein